MAGRGQRLGLVAAAAARAATAGVTICYGDSMNFGRRNDHGRRIDDESTVAWAPVGWADGDVMAVQSKAPAHGKARLLECIGEHPVHV